MPKITALRAEPLNVSLTEPFGIAGGAQAAAENVLVSLELEDGTQGLGEAAPFPAVSGETQTSTLGAIRELESAVVGEDAARWRRIAQGLAERAPKAPAARCAVEMALLDALCRHAKLSLWSFFGGKDAELTTDITIVTGSEEHARNSALRAVETGFDTLKVKIGGVDPDLDLRRLRAIAQAAPRARFVLDANASLAADDAVALLEALGPVRERVALFEQPTPAEDLDGLRKVREAARVRVAADESARSARAVSELVRERAADVVNVKLMKMGIAEALDLASAARAHGLGLMVGGMVETRLAMSASACFAAGFGGFSFVDLDTPLFMKDCPFVGGYEQSGARLELRSITGGHGVARARID